MSPDNKLSIVSPEPLYIPTDDSHDFRVSLADYLRTQCEAEKDISTLSSTLAKLANKLLKPISLIGDVEFISLHNDFCGSEDYAGYSKEKLRLLILDVLSEEVEGQSRAELISNIWSITFGKPKVMKDLAAAVRIDQDEAIAKLVKFLSDFEQPLSKYGLNNGYEIAVTNYLDNLTEHQKIRYLPRLKEALAKKVDSVVAQAFLKQLEILYQPQPKSYETILNQAQPKNQLSLTKAFDALVQGKCAEAKVWEAFFSQKLGKSNFPPLKRELGLRWLEYVRESYHSDPHFAAVYSPALWFQFAGLIQLQKSPSPGQVKGLDQLKDFYLSADVNGSIPSLFDVMLNVLSKAPKGKELISVYRTLFNQISGHGDFKGPELKVLLRVHTTFVDKYPSLCDKEHFDQIILPLIRRAAKFEEEIIVVLHLIEKYTEKSGDDTYCKFFYELVSNKVPFTGNSVQIVQSILQLQLQKAHKIPLQIINELSTSEEPEIIEVVYDLFIDVLQKCRNDKKLSQSAKREKYLIFVELLKNLCVKCSLGKFNHFMYVILGDLTKELKSLKISTISLYQALADRVVADAEKVKFNPYPVVAYRLWNELYFDETAAMAVAKKCLPCSIHSFLESAESFSEFTQNMLAMTEKLVPPLAVNTQGETTIVKEQPIIKLIFESISEIITNEPQHFRCAASSALAIATAQAYIFTVVENSLTEKYVLIPLLKLRMKSELANESDEMNEFLSEFIQAILSAPSTFSHISNMINSVTTNGPECLAALEHYLARIVTKISEDIDSIQEECQFSKESSVELLEKIEHFINFSSSILVNKNLSLEVKEATWNSFLDYFIKMLDQLGEVNDQSDHLISAKEGPISLLTTVFDDVCIAFNSYAIDTLVNLSKNEDEVECNNPTYTRMVRLIMNSCSKMLESGRKYEENGRYYLKPLLDFFSYFTRNIEVSKEEKKSKIGQLLNLAATCLSQIRQEDSIGQKLLMIYEDNYFDGVNSIQKLREWTKSGKTLDFHNEQPQKKISKPPKPLSDELKTGLIESLNGLVEELISTGSAAKISLALELVGNFWRNEQSSDDMTRAFAENYERILEASLNCKNEDLVKNQFHRRMLTPFIEKLNRVCHQISNTVDLRQGDNNKVMLLLTGSSDPKVDQIIRKLLATMARVLYDHIEKSDDEVLKETMALGFATLILKCKAYKLLIDLDLESIEKKSPLRLAECKNKIKSIYEQSKGITSSKENEEYALKIYGYFLQE